MFTYYTILYYYYTYYLFIITILYYIYRFGSVRLKFGLNSAVKTLSVVLFLVKFG